MVGLLVHMMSERKEVVLIAESQHSGRLYFGERENVFEDIAQSSSQSGIKAVENEVRKLLTHCVWLLIKVMSENDIGEAEVSCGSERHVTDYHAVGLSLMLVQDDQVCEFTFSARLHNVLQYIASSIHSHGPRD